MDTRMFFLCHGISHPIQVQKNKAPNYKADSLITHDLLTNSHKNLTRQGSCLNSCGLGKFASFDMVLSRKSLMSKKSLGFLAQYITRNPGGWIMSVCLSNFIIFLFQVKDRFPNLNVGESKHYVKRYVLGPILYEQFICVCWFLEKQFFFNSYFNWNAIFLPKWERGFLNFSHGSKVLPMVSTYD